MRLSYKYNPILTLDLFYIMPITCGEPFSRAFFDANSILKPARCQRVACDRAVLKWGFRYACHLAEAVHM
jgi:hypothetical protein